MHQRKSLIACLLLLLFITGMFTGAAAQNIKESAPIITPPAIQLTVTGRLTKIMAIGGETTGWALDLDKPRQIGDKMAKRLELDPAGQKLGDFENKHLEVAGTLEKSSGMERGEYWVLVVKNILVLSN